MDALANPHFYRRTAEEEEAEQAAQSFLESKQNRTSMLRDLNLKTKAKQCRYCSNDVCSAFDQLNLFSFMCSDRAKFYSEKTLA
jgi:hypothetical protein